MFTLQSITDQMTGKHILAQMAELMRKNSPEFSQAEKEYTKTLPKLRKSMGAARIRELENYLENTEKEIIAWVVYAGQLGYQANLDNFRSLTGNNFLLYDFSIILKEHIMRSFPVELQNIDWQTPFFQSLSWQQKEYLDIIDDYYSFFYVTGPKLAHYAGYVIANKLLPFTEPGYLPDIVQTHLYERILKDYCGYAPFSELG